MTLEGQCCPGILGDGSVGHFGCCDNTAAPTASPLFDTIGLHVPVPGKALIIQNVGAWNKAEGGVVLMLIQGEIHNDTQMM